MSSVREFKANLDNEIMSLGLDSSFRENPAFERIILEIESLMTYEDMNNAFVRREGNNFIFSWKNPYAKDEIRKFKIGSSSKDELVASVEVDSKKGLEHERIIDIKSFKINSNGWVEIINKHGTADNINCSIGRCNTRCCVTRKTYDMYGVQESEEVKEFNPSVVPMDINSITPMTILAVTDNKYNYWSQRTIVTRRFLDVAAVTIENRNLDKVVRGYQLIDNQTGLQDLRYNRNLTEKEKISELMQTEIEEMIEKEREYHSDKERVEKLIEGLRRYAEGRDRFSYDPENVNNNSYGTSQR